MVEIIQRAAINNNMDQSQSLNLTMLLCIKDLQTGL